MSAVYVERLDGDYRIAGTRVSLGSIVLAYLDGQSAEAIAQSYPVLSLEQVYGALAYYLAHAVDVHAYLAQGREEFERQWQAARDVDPMWYQKLAELKRATADA
jgi:uncharacterized protein (DUF433 family)